MKLTPGDVYKRTDIHAEFGGQRQGGISTPSKGDVILIFSGDAGHAYGYKDGWTEDGYFHYTGEGQVGDMEFVRGNQAIRDHKQNNKKILLFIYERKAYVKFHGEVGFLDYEIFRTPDRNEKIRQGIRFILGSVDSHSSPASTSATTNNKTIYKKPNITERKGLVTSRVGQGYYRQEIVNKYHGKCAVTGTDLLEILIASHITPWRISTDEEKLDVDNGILLCPTYDALFDKYLITFDDDGCIIISDSLSKEDIKRLGINISAKIDITEGTKKYLSKHRGNLR